MNTSSFQYMCVLEERRVDFIDPFRRKLSSP